MLELLLVLTVIGLLFGLGTFAFNRFRASTQMKVADARFTSEITAGGGQARNSAELQLRAGLELGSPTALTAQNVDRTGVLFLRLLEGSAAGVRQIRLQSVLDDTTTRIHVQTQNLPRVPLSTGDTGVVLELLLLGDDRNFEILASVPYRADGTVLLPLDTQPGRFVLDLGREKRAIDVSPSGKVKSSLLP